MKLSTTVRVFVCKSDFHASCRLFASAGVKLLLLVSFAFSVSPVFAKAVADSSAAGKEIADSLYTKGEYRVAAAAYSELTKKVRSAELYYNLGNCYYRLNEFPQARYAYEQAYVISPSNKDVRNNLKLTISKIKTNEAKSQSFISVWIHDFCYWFSIGEWLFTALFCFALFLASFLVYYFGRTIRIRKVAFFVSFAFFVVAAVSFVCAVVQTDNMENPSQAIVLETADVRQSPTLNAGTIKQILPGTKIELIDESVVEGWRQVSIGGDRKGWVRSSSIGVIGFEK